MHYDYVQGAGFEAFFKIPNSIARALNKRRYLNIIKDNISYFSMKHKL